MYNKKNEQTRYFLFKSYNCIKLGNYKILQIFQLKTVITFKQKIFYLFSFFIIDAPIQCASFYVERIDLASKLRKCKTKMAVQ